MLEEPTIEVEISAKEAGPPDVVTLTLSLPSRADLPAWTPGAHIDLVLPEGLSRQYSLCGSVEDRGSYRIGVQRTPDGRGGAAYVHEKLQVGDTVTIRGPRNHFELVESERYVFAAGGIGVTPLIPMARAALQSGADFEFVFCGRTRAAMPFLGELQDEFGSRLRVNDDDKSGLFDFATYWASSRTDTEIYVCGPPSFLDAALSATQHWPSRNVHFERFVPLEFDDSHDSTFEVELAKSGKVLEVPADKSILSVLTGHGVRVLSSCTEGTCGTCEVQVLGGDPIEHRDAVLTDSECASGEMMMVCVSRCKGARLVLDL